MPLADLLGLSADSWVAVGTLALAGATAYLAVKTGSLSATSQQELELLRQQALAAQAQSATAEAALLASVRPAVIDVAPGTLREVRRRGWAAFRPKDATRSETTKIDVSKLELSLGDPDGIGPQEFFLSVPMRNVGEGLARFTQVSLQIDEISIAGEPSQQNLPSNEICSAYIEAPDGSSEYTTAAKAFDGNPVSLIVSYTDLAGGQRSTSVFTLRGELPPPERGEELPYYYVADVQVTPEFGSQGH